MPDIGDVYRVIAKGLLVNTVQTRGMFGYHLTSANCTETEVAVALETAVENMYNSVYPDFSNAYVIYGTETQKWHPRVQSVPGYWLTYHEHTCSIAGTSTADLVSYQAAALITLKTAAKRVLGRKFLAGLVEDQTLMGDLTGSFLVAVGTFLTAMLTNVTFGTGAVAKPGVLGKDGTFHEYIGGVVGSIVSSMRRRKPGYGI